jgi:hypothetical protein
MKQIHTIPKHGISKLLPAQAGTEGKSLHAEGDYRLTLPLYIPF